MISNNATHFYRKMSLKLWENKGLAMVIRGAGDYNYKDLFPANMDPSCDIRIVFLMRNDLLWVNVSGRIS